MAFDNKDAKSMNSPLTLSLSHAGSDTDGLWVVLNHGSLSAMNRFSVVLVCGLSVMAIGGEAFKGSCQRLQIKALLNCHLA